MILITSTLVLFMASVGHGNPLPDPYPEPNLIIQVRQVVHRRNCNKPHDKEGPFGHPTTDATGGDEDLNEQLEAIDAEIIEAEQALINTTQEVEELENEVAEQQAEADAVNDVFDDIDDLDFDFRRKRRASFYDNVKDLLGESHRSRRGIAYVGSDAHTITYCQEGDKTDTGFNLWKKLLTDLAEALKPPRKTSKLRCLISAMKELKALNIQLTADEKLTLKALKNAAKAQAQAAKKEAEQAVTTSKAKLVAKKAKQESLKKDIEEKKKEKKKKEDELAGITPAPETTDLPDTTIETTLVTKEVTTAAVEIPPTTEPSEE